MSNTAQKYKKYYDAGWWSEDMLQTALEKGKITQEEYDEIIGSDD